MTKVGKVIPAFISAEKKNKFSEIKEINSNANQKKIFDNVNLNLPIVLTIINGSVLLNKKELVLHLFQQNHPKRKIYIFNVL